MFVLFYCNIGSTGMWPNGQETGGKPLFQSYLPNLASCLPHMENHVTESGVGHGHRVWPQTGFLVYFCCVNWVICTYIILSHSTIVSCPYIVIKPLKHRSYSIIPSTSTCTLYCSTLPPYLHPIVLLHFHMVIWLCIAVHDFVYCSYYFTLFTITYAL